MKANLNKIIFQQYRLCVWSYEP